MEDLTEKLPSPTIHLDELYRQISAAARFVSLVRRDLPDIRSRVTRMDPNSSDRVLREMAVNNLGSNLQVFADLVNELFVKLVEKDKTLAQKHAPIYSQIPEMADVGRLLVGG
jgi:hypothetical protein